MPISQLDARTAKLIGSSLVISSVYNVVKELLENAVDAGATSINIFLEKYGQNRIEVRDNGSGICHEDIPLACMAGHTSKIQNFSDMDLLHSYGFRGQALSALCTVSDLSFTTRTSDDEMASTYSVDKEGRIISSVPSHLGVGTTVIVKNLFINLPVRRKLLSKSPSSLRTISWLLRSYSMAKPNLAVSLVHDGSLVWRKSSAHALTSAVQEALGYKLAVLMHQMYWKGSSCNSALTSEEEISEEVEVEMDIMVPKKGSNISEFCSTQAVEGIVLNEYLIINGRPVKHKKVEKLMTDCISKGLGCEFPNRKKPPWVLRLNVPPHQLDVNVEPDKTKVFLRCEDVILRAIEERIIIYYGIQVPSADPSSQSLEKKAIKKKNTLPNEADGSQDAVLSSSPHNLGSGRGDVNETTSELRENVFSHPPPAKLPRIEIEESDLRSARDDLNSDAIDPSKISQPFISLEPFDITDSQISEIASSQDLKHDEVVLDVGPLKRQAEESGLGSFRIEVLRKSEDITVENVNLNLRTDGSSENEKSGSDSKKSQNEIEDIIKEKSISEKSTGDKIELDSEDEVVIMEAVNILKNMESEEELDPDAWSRGKISANGVAVEEPVKILTSKPNHQLSSDSASGPKPITNQQVSSAPFKMLRKSDVEGKPSTSHSLSTSKDNGLNTSVVTSPLPNAISQLGRRDMRGFDCFASKARPKIIAEQPGILFTNVASELAKRWEELSDEEREEYKKQALEKVAARQKIANSEAVVERSLPKKTAKKFPGILEEKDKQETLLKKVVKEKQEMFCLPTYGRTMNVSIAEIKRRFEKRDELESEEQPEKAADKKIRLVGQLKPSGMWVYKQGDSIGILRHFALQELVVYQKLMAGLSLPIQPLRVPIAFDERAVGSELWKKFISLGSNYDVIKQQNLVASELLVKNGFQISLLPGEDESGSSALITGIASVITPYGVDDLKDVLQIIDSSEGKLSKCRTLQISSYIESEAVRMCRQSSPVMPRHDVLTLLKQWNGRLNCLHSRPVLVPFENIIKPEFQVMAS